MPDKKTVYWFSLYFDIYRDIMKLPTVKQSFYLIIFAKSLKIFREGLSFPMINVKALADAHYDELVKLRRYFHEHPELSNVEDATCDTIQKKLEEYGIRTEVVEHGGVFGFIDNGPGKTVLMRADIDGLPIQETETNLNQKRVCVSKNPGVMHACGHDGHISMLLTEAKILQEIKDQWSGRVIFMFERAEEGSDATQHLMPYLLKQNIDYCYGTHVRWDVPAGKINVEKGAAMAGGFAFQIKIKGHGGHGSRPDLSQSPIDCFHAFYGNLQALRMRDVNPLECLTLSIGTVQAGSAYNVIPNELFFGGSSRFFSYEHAGKKFYDDFLKLLKNECDNYDCTYELVRMKQPLLEVRNNPVCGDYARKAVAKYLGEDALYDVEPWMASETFGLTLSLFPGVFTFTGIANKEKGCGGNHHTPQFDIDEEGLRAGVVAGVGYTLEMLAAKPEIEFKQNTEDPVQLGLRGM